jgi:peptide-methionine (S)-S-oxide reductase
MRGKYRSAIYTFDDVQFKQALHILKVLRADFDKAVITQVYTFKSFKPNKVELTDYVYSAHERPFCQTYIQPKLRVLIARFHRHVEQHKMAEVDLKVSNNYLN